MMVDTVAGAEEPLDPDVGVRRQERHRPGDRSDRRQDREVLHGPPAAVLIAPRWPGPSSRSPAQEDDLPLRRCRGQFHRVERGIDHPDIEPSPPLFSREEDLPGTRSMSPKDARVTPGRLPSAIAAST
jgi:hypothetical protein